MRGLLVVALLLSVVATNVFGQMFSEEASSRGLSLVTSFGFGGPIFGYGVALNDLDGDGDPDCIVTGVDLGQVRVLENDGTGNFIDRTVGSGLPASLDFNGVSCADYDGDGDLDVHLTGREVANALLRNEGGFLFTDVTVESGVGDEGEGAGACWGDFDGDGWLDLYVVNYAPSGQYGADSINALFRNNGDGTFTEVGEAQGVDDPYAGFDAIFFDHDLDGDLDLYLANDFGDGVDDNRNRLWRNDAGQFVDISDSSGAGVGMDAMGVSAGDLNRDGFLDLYVSDNPPANLLLINDGDGTYTDSTDVAEAFGLGGRGWGNAFIDFDNDSWLEILAVSSVAPNALYDWSGTYPMSDIAPAVGIDDAMYAFPGSSFCCATGDVDLDGDVDVLVQSWNEPLALYINEDGSNQSWLRARLRATGNDPSAIGAVLTARIGPESQTAHVAAGSGYKSSSEFIVHFGLDAATQVDQLLVRWPDRSLSLLADVAANQVLQIDQATAPAALDCDGNLVPDTWQILADPSLDLDGDGVLDSCGAIATFRRGDANVDGASDLGDSIAILTYVFSSGLIPCLDAADVNDDGAVDIADPVYLLTHLFSGGFPPPAPGPSLCGADPSGDFAGDLGCAAPCLP